MDMSLIHQLFGNGKELTVLQMGCRGVTVFIIALVFLRLSGRRSFGLNSSFDTVITILLGAVLSRAVAGASPFLPTITTSLIIVVLHRVVGWGTVHSPAFSRLVQGEKMELFSNGKLNIKNMNRALVCEEDVMEGVRKNAAVEDTSTTERIYMERNGDMSVIKKHKT